MTKHVPERWRLVHSDLQTYFHECRSDEQTPEWPTVSCANAIEQLGAAEAKVAELELELTLERDKTDYVAEECNTLQAQVRKLLEVVKTVVYQANGKPWNYYGWYRGVDIVLSEKQLEAWNKLLADLLQDLKENL